MAYHWTRKKQSMRDYSAAALKEGVSQETIGVYAQTRSLQRTSTLKLNTRYVKGKLVQKFLAKRATFSGAYLSFWTGISVYFRGWLFLQKVVCVRFGRQEKLLYTRTRTKKAAY